MSGVVFDKVRKVFPGGAVAVEGLDLAIREREFLSLLGPSGCGKTTTLRMSAGLEHPTSGRIRVGGGSPRERATAGTGAPPPSPRFLLTGPIAAAVPSTVELPGGRPWPRH